MPAERPRVEVEVVYGPQYAAGTRRAGAVLRQLLDRAIAEHFDRFCPACQARVTSTDAFLSAPCFRGTCPDLTEAQRAWWAAHLPKETGDGR